MEKNSFFLKGLQPFRVTINHGKNTFFTDYYDQNNPGAHHIHDECEIYYNISGNVSFWVENTLYQISSGSIIITRPYEFHHCAYHTEDPHYHYTIHFTPIGNESLLDIFFKREKGKSNLIVLPTRENDEFHLLLYAMTREQTTIEKYLNFFRLLKLLNSKYAIYKDNINPSDEISTTLEYINEHISEQIKISELAANVHMSINTFERHFKNNLGISPREFILNKRLSLSIKLLESNLSVQKVCEKSGFTDCSHYISIFKKNFGQTPLQYKKNHMEDRLKYKDLPST